MISVATVYFFYSIVIISREHLKRSIMSRVLVFILQLLLQPSIVASSMVDFRKFKGYCVYLRNAIVVLLC